MKLSGIDANLLASLEALLQERSVTRAARRLGVGQPAVSHSLARLRRQFNDPLLVLQGRSYVLTPKAIQLGVAVAKATRALADVFEDRPPFVPATSTQRFVIACSDWVGPVVLPPLVDLVRREASSVDRLCHYVARARVRTPRALFKVEPRLGRRAAAALAEPHRVSAELLRDRPHVALVSEEATPKRRLSRLATR